MIQKKKKPHYGFSVLVIPGDHQKIHKLHVSARQLYLLGSGVGLALLVFLTSLGGLWYYRSLSGQMMVEHVAYQDFKQERQGLMEKVRLLEASVEQTEKYAVQLGSLVGATPPSLEKGVGPVRDYEFSGVAETAEPVSLTQTMDQLNQLQKRSDRIRERVVELYEVQKDHLTFVAHTPTLWPVKGWVTSEFGGRRSPFGYQREFHNGMDIASTRGTPVLATADGVATHVGSYGGLGRAVILDHGFGIKSYYGHNSETLVQEGQKIRKGQVVSRVGSTGHSTGPHLHFEVRVDGVPVDPMRFLMGDELPRLASSRKPTAK